MGEVMLRCLVALVSFFVAATANAEEGRPECDTARALQVSYHLKVYSLPVDVFVPQLNWPAMKTFCLIAGRQVDLSAEGVSVKVALHGNTPTNSKLLIDHPRVGNVYFGQTDFSLAWLATQGFDSAGSTDEALLRSILPDEDFGKLLHIPLRRRHAYNPATDGHWQYVPLQTEVFGELVLRIGGSDAPPEVNSANL